MLKNWCLKTCLKTGVSNGINFWILKSILFYFCSYYLTSPTVSLRIFACLLIPLHVFTSRCMSLHLYASRIILHLLTLSYISYSLFTSLPSRSLFTSPSTLITRIQNARLRHPQIQYKIWHKFAKFQKYYLCHTIRP